MANGVRWLAVAMVVGLLCIDASSAPDKAEAPDWRAANPRADFLARRLNARDSNQYDFTAFDLVAEFARDANVQIVFDAVQLNNVPKLSITGGGAVRETPLFELCQRCLDQNNLTLVGDGKRTFHVISIGRVTERAPTSTEAELGELSTSEWVTLTLPLRGKAARRILGTVRPLLSAMGGTAIASDDGATLVLVEKAGNLPRVIEVVRAVDTETVIEPPVAYQRRAVASVSNLVSTLNRFLERYARARGVPDNNLSLTYDSHAQVVVGQVPKDLASFLDAAIDAAAVAEKQRADAKEAEERNFVTFDLAAGEGVSILEIESGLRALFAPECNLGDARFVVKDREKGTMVVRCRSWLEKGVRDAAISFNSK